MGTMDLPTTQGTIPTSDHIATLIKILRSGDVFPVFQPILDVRRIAYMGFETLIRGPENSSLHRPAELFAAADAAGLMEDLEHLCREKSLRAFAALRLPGNLFLNVTPSRLLDPRLGGEWMENLLDEINLSPSRIVLELTENQKISDIPHLPAVLRNYRNKGYRIAIDDLGEGFSNLKMWSEVRPEFVKIDRSFIHGIADDDIKHHFVRAMIDLAEICHAPIIGEGVERLEDLKRLREMGVAYAQGYFIDTPKTQPSTQVCKTIFDVLEQEHLAVSTHYSYAGKPVTASSLMHHITPVQIGTRNDDVIARFEAEPDLDVLPVLNGDVPVGLIHRHNMIDRFARPFRKEVFGRRPCELFMNAEPLIVDETEAVQALAIMISQAPKHHLFDGFIVTREGRYLGIGNSHDLMTIMTELQIKAARYANPLTQLPGNVPINEHIDRMLEEQRNFVAAYIDIDRFKPFNDTLGYRRGDDVIQLLGRLIRENTDSQFDFVGHIGGDDFMVVFQSSDWEIRCEAIIHKFAQAITELVPETDHSQGGYFAENRRGEVVFEALPSLSIGAVRVAPLQYESHREVAVAASDAKKQAKKKNNQNLPIGKGFGSGGLFVERRTHPSASHLVQH